MRIEINRYILLFTDCVPKLICDIHCINENDVRFIFFQPFPDFITVFSFSQGKKSGFLWKIPKSFPSLDKKAGMC